MSYDQTNLNTIVEKLGKLDADLPLIFMTDEGEIGGGYHVTELKQHTITGIDCAGNIDSWQETHLQLLDMPMGSHMQIKKFTSIMAQSIKSINALGEAPIFIEYAPSNKGLRRYTINAVTEKEAGLYVLLVEDRASCKPASVSEAGKRCC